MTAARPMRVRSLCMPRISLAGNPVPAHSTSFLSVQRSKGPLRCCLMQGLATVTQHIGTRSPPTDAIRRSITAGVATLIHLDPTMQIVQPQSTFATLSDLCKKPILPLKLHATCIMAAMAMAAMAVAQAPKMATVPSPCCGTPCLWRSGGEVYHVRCGTTVLMESNIVVRTAAARAAKAAVRAAKAATRKGPSGWCF